MRVSSETSVFNAQNGEVIFQLKRLTSYEPPDAMLTDFGCASDKAVILYDKPGTTPYLAPEQPEGKTHGKAVDYWSCGIVGLELIRKRPIPMRIMPGSTLLDYQTSVEGLESPLAKCSKAMLEVNPDTRMTAAAVGVHFLSRCILILA